MSPYKYRSLGPDAKTIRLMTLLPGSFTDRISVSLVKSVLDPDTNQIPRYEALSYTWGSPIPPICIEITEHLTIFGRVSVTRNQRLYVTQNLADALRYLRFKETPRVMWIDAICVDQQNLKERGRQVQRMADIFRNAERVLVWIGHASNDSAHAIETLRIVSSRIEVDWNSGSLKSSKGEETHWADLEVSLAYENETWASIHSLIHRPWFKRLWIWQEVLLADTAEIHCGHERMNWENFRKAIYIIGVKPKLKSGYADLKTREDFQEIFPRVWSLTRSSAEPMPFQHVLSYTTHCEFTDPRDRIYAVLNLSIRSPALLGLQPDYTKQPRDIYQDVVIRHLMHEGTLDLLVDCGSHGDTINKPTWVPEWSKPPLSSHVFNHFFRYRPKAKAKLVGKGSLLVTGVRCAGISVIGRNILLDEALLHAQHLDAIHLIKSLAGHLNMDFPYKDGRDMYEALCHTICRNRFSDNYIPAMTGVPDSGESLKYLRSILAEPSRPIEPYDTFLDRVLMESKGKHFFVTKEGYIGLAPKAVKLGDQVCIILGCRSPLLLRREQNESHIVIGECYIHGLMSGEALLGPLPSEWRCVGIYDDDLRYHIEGFSDLETGGLAFVDPRLGQLPSGWRLEDTEYRPDWFNWFVNVETGEALKWPDDPRMTAEALISRGVPLREFLLV